MLWQDLRHTLRTLARTPTTAAFAVATLAIGIGGNTAAYSWISALLLRPYDFPDLPRLVSVYERHAQAGGEVSHNGRAAGRNPMAPGDFLDLQGNSRAWKGLSAYRYQRVYLLGGGDPELVLGIEANCDLLDTLGVQVALGRALQAEDCAPGHDEAVLVSDGYWHRRFGADPRVLGRRVTLNQRAFTIVGVLPPGLAFPVGGADLWSPLAFSPALAEDRKTLALRVVGRLARGVEIETAQAEIDTLAARWAQTFPASNAGRGLLLVPLREQQIGLVAPFLYLFLGAAGFVLLIACANVSGLLLARVTARQQEMAVRAALGASRWRVVRLVLTESLLLALVGGGLAVLLASVGVQLIRTSLPADIAKWVAGWKDIRVDPNAMAFTFLVALLAALLAGLLPALRASGGDLARALGDGGRSAASGRRRHLLRRVLVVSQLVLALVLTASAALLVQGFTRLTGVYRDLDPKGALTFAIQLPDWRYAEPHRITGFYRRLVAELAAIPGAEDVAVVSHLPADLGPVPGGGFAIAGRPALTSSEQPYADFQSVSPGYFSALRMRRIDGRLLGEEDSEKAAPVAVVSESLAQRFWPGGSPLGQRIKLGPPGDPGPWRRVVGVVSDVKQYWFDREPRPTVYLPYLQDPRRSTFVVLRTHGDPLSLAGPARRSVLAVDAAQPVEEVRTFEQVVRDSMAFLRIAASLLGGLAVLACLLGAVGLYGLLGHHVEQHTQAIGVRMALGATPGRVVRLVLGQAAALAALGIAIGAPASFAVGRLLSGALYGVVGTDAAVLTGIAALLAFVALLASYLPAQRAASLEPGIALRGG